MHETTGEIIRLQRSSAYWAGRAARHRREGNRRRAAALLRYAVRQSPADGELRMAYAQALQELECYEASTREAFGALNLNPRRYACYGLIGRNMLALGYEQEALDAFTRYLWAVRREGVPAEYDEDLDTLEMLDSERPRLRARHDAQLGIAGRRIARGDVPGAETALRRARPARNLDDRYGALRALLLTAKGNPRAAVRSARRACQCNPGSIRARCTLAGAYHSVGNRARAAATLLRAAPLCLTAQEELLFCTTALQLGFAPLALTVLRKALRQSPDRLPTAYNAAVVLLRLGRMAEAEPLLQRCRDLDPADVPSRCTNHTLQQWQELELTPQQVVAAARAMPFYPALSPAGNADCMAQLATALVEGLDAFCARLQEEDDLYRLLLYKLGDPDHQLLRLLTLVIPQLPEDFAQRLLREVLVQPTPDEAVKRFAAGALMALGAPPPFVVWHEGRIAEIDPFVQNRRDANLPRVMLVRRMVDIQHKTGDSRLMTHALRLLNRMGPKRRERVVRDTDGVFRAALEQHYLLTYGLPDNGRLNSLLRYTADERRQVHLAYRWFCRLVPLPKPRPKA